jgi:predicted O-methyltransferase YrrM
MIELIRQLYETGVAVGQSGQAHNIRDHIDPQEGEFIVNVIQSDASIVRTLEIGCAHGLSSLHICAAIQGRPGASHTIIDPFQDIQWDGVGLRNLEKAKVDFCTFINVRSEFALPHLLEENEGKFDFVFIDGWHTLDHTLLDCFYASRLLRVGGLLAIDDVNFPSVEWVVDFFKSYPCYEEHGSVSSETPPSWKKRVVRTLLSPVRREMWSKVIAKRLYHRLFDDRSTRLIILRKTQEDNRNWNWHADAV